MEPQDFPLGQITVGQPIDGPHAPEGPWRDAEAVLDGHALIAVGNR
jgi:hypothetical protein